LLDLRSTALYLGGISPWTVRAMIAAGTIRPIQVPGLRRLLLDRLALDDLISRWAAGQRTEAGEEAHG
jgi:hypothetical protein